MSLRKHVIRNFNISAATFEDAAFLFSEINQKMIQRLHVMSLKPERILDCGCGTGIGSRLLMDTFRQSQVVSFDLSLNMIQRAKGQKPWFKKNYFVCGDTGNLPFANDSFDFIFANLMLHWCDDLQVIFKEWQRVLKPEGLLMFTVFGPDSLKELAMAVAAIDPEQKLQGFIDMHDIGDALLKNQLVDPVMDVENLQINYSDAKKLLKELRAVGGRNLHPLRTKHVYNQNYLKKLALELNKQKTPTGKIPLTIELIYGHAWSGMAAENKKNKSEISIPVSSVLKK